MTDTITIKGIEFDLVSFCKMAKQIDTWVKDSNSFDLSDKVSARVDECGLKLIKQYVDHHTDDEKSVAMKPLKPNIHRSIADVFKNFDPWDGEFIEGLDHIQLTSLKIIAMEFHMMALIDKICIFIAFHMTQSLNSTEVDSLDEAKMIKIFKDDLNIDMPNLPKKLEIEDNE